MVRVVPFHYTGKVWCLRVPTGAFVAVRNGVAFPTGNSGFPKSLDVSKAIDRAAGAEREVTGDGPFAARRPRADKETQGSAFADDGYLRPAGQPITAPATDAAVQWQGWGTALKPALEPITLARKPLVGTVAANVLAHGTGALNIDGCRVEAPCDANRARPPRTPNSTFDRGKGTNLTASEHNDAGRWPANLAHDGSAEVLGAFPSSKSGTETQPRGTGGIWSGVTNSPCGPQYGDSGSAARFYYCAKASKRDREEGLEGFEVQAAGGLSGRSDGSLGSITRRANVHPTVKPTDLMRWLCRLVTPPGGLVLDPFAGSGSTGKAAVLEGFRFLGLELSDEYAAIANARIEAARRDRA